MTPARTFNVEELCLALALVRRADPTKFKSEKVKALIHKCRALDASDAVRFVP